MSNTISATAAALVNLDKNAKVFDIQGMRIIRSLIPELANIKGVVGAPMFISIANLLINDFKQSIKINNKKILKLNTETNKMVGIDKESYQDKIAVNLKSITDLEAANVNLRLQLTKVEESIRIAKMGNFEAAPLFSRINYVFKLRIALRKLVKNKEEIDWLIQEIITSPEELKEYLSKNNINEQEHMAVNISKVLTEDVAIFKSQLNKLKDFIREIDPEVYKEIETVDDLDLNDLGRLVSFVKNFDRFYKKVRNTEEFLKVEGITEELAMSTASILSLSIIVDPLKQNNIATTAEMIQNLANENLKQNAVKVILSYHLVHGYIHELFDLDKDMMYDKAYIDKLVTFVLVSVYHLLDISAGAAVLNLLTKVHI